MFSGLSQSYKIHLSALLGLATDRNDRFPYPFTRKPEKGTPFERSLPVPGGGVLDISLGDPV